MNRDTMADGRLIGYHIIHTGQIDPENGEALQTAYAAAEDATEAELEARVASVSAVLWTRRRRANEFKFLKAERVKRARREGLERARQLKQKVREQDITAEEIHINTAMVKLEADIRADAEMAGEDPDQVIQKLRAQAHEGMNGTAGEA